MARRTVVTYRTQGGSERVSTGAYYLATTADVIQFYCFDEPRTDGAHEWHLIDVLDRTKLLGAGDKATAKVWAKRLGLKSWTYVRV